MARTQIRVQTDIRPGAEDQVLQVKDGILDYVNVTEITDGFVTDAELATESTARQSGDTTLQTNIDAVVTNLASETSARTAADTALSTQVGDVEDSVTAEVTARTSADTALGARIDGVVTSVSTEVTDRTTADTALQTQIDALESKANVRGSVDTFAELEALSTTDLVDGDSYIVLADETHDDGTTEYVWNGTAWVYAGSFSVNLADYATVTALTTETSARTSADSALDTRVTAIEDADYITDAPADGKSYVRVDNAWAQNSAVGSLVITDTSTTAIANGTQTAFVATATGLTPTPANYTARVYRNGILMEKGSGNDYLETVATGSYTATFATAPMADDKVVITLTTFDLV